MSTSERRLIEAGERLWAAWLEYGPMGTDGSPQGDAIQEALRALKRACREARANLDARVLANLDPYNRDGVDD